MERLFELLFLLYSCCQENIHFMSLFGLTDVILLDILPSVITADGCQSG